MKKNIIARKTTLEEDDGSFDVTFWSSVDAETKMNQTFELSMMYNEITRGEKTESAFQRDVVRIQRS